jgi:hypothetical protein
MRKVASSGGRNRRNHYFITVPENPDKITLKKLQGKNNPVIGDTKTLTPMSGALNHHRTISKRVRSKTALLPDPAVNEFKEFWAGAYRKQFEVEYHFEHAKDGAHIKALLTSFDLPTLKQKAEKFFLGDDEWTQTKGGFTIGVFRSQINRLNSTGTKPSVAASRGLQEIPRL